jgi:DNA-binding response OmpR family regulator
MEESVKRILVVEDDEQALRLFVNFLERHRNVMVQGCHCLSESRLLIQAFKPHLLLCDLDLPDGLGLELLEILERSERQIPVFFVSGHMERYAQRIPSAHHIVVLAKPVSLQLLWDKVREKLYEEDHTASPFSLSDYLQIATQGQHTIRIEWRDKGFLQIKEGQLWFAQDDQGSGEAALKRLVVRSEIYRDGGEIHCRKIPVTQLNARNIFSSSEHLLLNAISEEENLLQTLPGGNREWAEQLRKEAAFEDIMDEALSFLLKKNYKNALSLLMKAKELQPENKTVLVNINRLQDMGIQAEEET